MFIFLLFLFEGRFFLVCFLVSFTLITVGCFRGRFTIPSLFLFRSLRRGFFRTRLFQSVDFGQNWTQNDLLIKGSVSSFWYFLTHGGTLSFVFFKGLGFFCPKVRLNKTRQVSGACSYNGPHERSLRLRARGGICIT